MIAQGDWQFVPSKGLPAGYEIRRLYIGWGWLVALFPREGPPALTFVPELPPL